VQPYGETLVPEEVVRCSDDLPVQGALATGTRRIHETLETVPGRVREVAGEAGYEAVWVEPVPARAEDGAGVTHGVLVMWRRRSGPPSPNQLSSIHQGAAVLGLAFDR
jgi:hypothetical protein